MFGACCVVGPRVLLRIVVDEPVPDHLAHAFGVLGDVLPVGLVEDLAVVEAHFLGAGDAFEAGGGGVRISDCGGDVEVESLGG